MYTKKRVYYLKDTRQRTLASCQGNRLPRYLRRYTSDYEQIEI